MGVFRTFLGNVFTVFTKEDLIRGRRIELKKTKGTWLSFVIHYGNVKNNHSMS